MYYQNGIREINIRISVWNSIIENRMVVVTKDI